MILYASTKAAFQMDVTSNRIEDILVDGFRNRFGIRVGTSERKSWQSSLMYMNNALALPEISPDATVALEFRVPNSSKRIDFILAGQNETGRDSLVIVELKQWSELVKTEKDGIVSTRYAQGVKEVPHPSYQAWSYASLLRDFNSFVQDENIELHPCAYLHNCTDESVVLDPFYNEHVERAPVFLRRDVEKLSAFLKKHVHHGDKNGLLYKIDNGKIRPSKQLADSLLSMLKGNEEFVLIDDQKVVFETAVELAKKSTAKNKNVLIVHGGPGTGKSVVAVNLLVRLTQLEKTAQYVSKNAAPRAVYQQKLTGSLRRTHIDSLFVSSGSFWSAQKNEFDALIVDEAHRMNAKSGMFSNKGENQVKEVIRSAFFSVFFLDEDQKVTFKDIGSREEIVKWAKKEGAALTEMQLSSQFRCAGSDAYTAWLDNVLQIKETANTELDGGFDFQVFDTPDAMHSRIEEANSINNKARTVAGYCWDWKSKTNRRAFDIEIGPTYRRQWNLASDGSAWIIQPTSVDQVGCIHTCQGLEVDYIGVILGDDLVARDGKILTNPKAHPGRDQAIKGWKALAKKDPESAQRKVDALIKNTYRTLMTRGMKGCYVYSVDPETREYLKANQRRR